MMFALRANDVVFMKGKHHIIDRAAIYITPQNKKRKETPMNACQTNYYNLCSQLRSLISGVPYLTADLANAAALLFSELPDLNWVGFYFLKGNVLVLGPFQGKTACIEIPVGKGVCGTAAQKNETQLVPDVHLFPGHIACDSESRSEIVVPIRQNGKPIAVLDLDSPVAGRFTEADRDGLEQIARILEEECGNLLGKELP